MPALCRREEIEVGGPARRVVAEAGEQPLKAVQQRLRARPIEIGRIEGELDQHRAMPVVLGHIDGERIGFGAAQDGGLDAHACHAEIEVRQLGRDIGEEDIEHATAAFAADAERAADLVDRRALERIVAAELFAHMRGDGSRSICGSIRIGTGIAPLYIPTLPRAERPRPGTATPRTTLSDCVEISGQRRREPEQRRQRTYIRGVA